MTAGRRPAQVGVPAEPGRRALGVVLDGRHRAARAEEPVKWRHGERTELLTEAAVLPDGEALYGRRDLIPGKAAVVGFTDAGRRRGSSS